MTTGDDTRSSTTSTEPEEMVVVDTFGGPLVRIPAHVAGFSAPTPVAMGAGVPVVPMTYQQPSTGTPGISVVGRHITVSVMREPAWYGDLAAGHPIDLRNDAADPATLTYLRLGERMVLRYPRSTVIPGGDLGFPDRVTDTYMFATGDASILQVVVEGVTEAEALAFLSRIDAPLPTGG